MNEIFDGRETWNDYYVDSSCDFHGCRRMSTTVTWRGANGFHPFLSSPGLKNIFVGDSVAHPLKTPRKLSVAFSSMAGIDCRRTGTGETRTPTVIQSESGWT